MAKQFENHKSWKSLNDPDSILVKFLNDFCVSEDGFVDLIKIKAVGILWC